VSKVFVFLCISFSVLLSNYIGTDNYRILLEKNRIESLNSSVKLSINSANNDYSWHINNLNINNSRLLNLFEKNDLSAREIIILNHIEENITTDIISNGDAMTCESVVTNGFNTIGITRSECINLEIKIDNYYESSYCRVGIPISGRLNELDDEGAENYKKLKFKNRRDIQLIYDNLKRIASFNRSINSNIANMDEETLRMYCNKIMDEETTMLSKDLIAQSIVNKASDFVPLGNDIRAKCSTYDFTSRQETCGVYRTIPLSNNLSDLLNDIIVDTQSEISTVNTQKSNKQTEITDKENDIRAITGCDIPLPFTTTLGYPCLGEQIAYDELRSQLTDLQTELSILQTSLSEYNAILSHVAPGTTVVGILNYLDRRAVNQNLKDLINRINWLNYYISHYIMHNGVVPSVADLRATYDEVDVIAWPNEYGGNNDVTFNVDMVNFTVKYSGLNIPMSTETSYVREIYQNNLALKQKAIIDSTNMDMIIPMDFKMVEFLKRINNMPINNTILGNINDEACNVANQNISLYEPNGTGYFNHYICNWAVSGAWDRLEIFNQVEIETRMNNSIYLMGKKFYTHDTVLGNPSTEHIMSDDSGNNVRIRK
jgi:hypothetical protein